MAGGVGSRFWPLSTQKFPKQYQDILGVGKTMIQQTFQRISRLIPLENVFVITNTEYVDITREQLPELPKENIVGEPVMKNTAACNIYMAYKIAAINPNAQIVVCPADHLILKEDRFLEKLEQALGYAEKGDYLITLGIKPTRPDTGYGYIQFIDDEQGRDNPSLLKVKTFTEKPNLEIAKNFLKAGDFLWNAGIFIWSVESIISAFAKYLPNMKKLFDESQYMPNSSHKLCIEDIYPRLESISIDNGILEKTDNVYVIPADLGWSDLGTWNSVYENSDKDENKNAILSKNILSYNANGNIVRSKSIDKAIIIDGLKDYIIVDTENALLICPRENDQKLKDYLVDLRTMKKGDRYL